MKKLSIDSIIYSAGTLFNAFLGLVYFVLVARALGPSAFGIVSVILSIAVAISDIFDFGMNTTMLKFLPGAQGQEKIQLSKDFFTYKLFSVIAVVIIGIIFSNLISNVLFKDDNLVLLNFYGFLCASALIFFGYVNSNLQASKRFVSSVVLNLLSNVFRLAATALLFYKGSLTMDLALIFYFVPVFLAPILWGIADKDITFRPVFTKDIFLPILKYGKWVAASMAVASVGSRLDNILLVNLANSFQAGIYTSVQRIFLAFNQIPAGISMVMAPDLSATDQIKKKRAFNFGLWASAIISVGLVVLIFLAPWIIPLTFGQEFLLSIWPFQVLTVGTIFFVMSTPFQAYILYDRAKSDQNFVITFTKFAATIGLNLWLIPNYQSLGAAISYAGVSLLGLFLIMIFYLKK